MTAPNNPEKQPSAPPVSQAGTLGVQKAKDTVTADSVLTNLSRLTDVPRQILDEFRNKFKFLPEANYKMGCEFADKGLYRDAVFRLKVALWLNPNMARAWYVLGSCYYARGETAQAVGALQHSIKLNPASEEAAFMLATIDAKYLAADKRPKTMPRHMAMDYFDRIADSYEFQQREMGYVGHVVLDDAVRGYIDARQVNFRMLDLGCGTGLTGYMLADVAGHLTGVDFSRGMLDHAMKRRRKDGRDLYTRTIMRDIREYLGDLDRASFDLVTASHVFNFMGDLEVVFAGVAKALKDGGVFAFQVEPYAEVGFGMLPGRGRFSHSEAYIRGLMEKNGLELLELKKEEVYPSFPFDQYVLHKKPENIA